MKTSILAMSAALLVASATASPGALAQDAATADAPAQTAAPATEAADAADAADAIATASRFLDRFYAGDYEGAREDFDATMLEGLDAAKLAAVGTQLEGAGPLESRGTPQVSSVQGYQVLVFPLQHEAAAVDGTISIDGEGRIAGVFFTPASAGGAN